MEFLFRVMKVPKKILQAVSGEATCVDSTGAAGTGSQGSPVSNRTEPDQVLWEPRERDQRE